MYSPPLDGLRHDSEVQSFDEKALMPRTADTVPAQPFVDWINREATRLRADHTLLGDSQDEVSVNTILAERLGTTSRSVYRYLRSLDGESRPTTLYERKIIESLLDHTGVRLWEIYPDLDQSRPLEQPAYCTACRETVTPIAGRCPWCEGPTGAKPKGSTPRRRQASFMTDEQVRAAHILYIRNNLSAAQLGEMLWAQYGYRSPASCAQALRDAFRALGLERRDRRGWVAGRRRESRPAFPIDPRIIEKARYMHHTQGLRLYTVARAVIDETPYDNLKSLASRLRRELMRQGVYHQRRRSPTPRRQAAA